MELIKTQYKIRCELGACRNLAVNTLKLNRVGIKSRVHICDSCLSELYSVIGASLIPKSRETLKKRDDGYTIGAVTEDGESGERGGTEKETGEMHVKKIARKKNRE